MGKKGKGGALLAGGKGDLNALVALGLEMGEGGLVDVAGDSWAVASPAMRRAAMEEEAAALFLKEALVAGGGILDGSCEGKGLLAVLDGGKEEWPELLAAQGGAGAVKSPASIRSGGKMLRSGRMWGGPAVDGGGVSREEYVNSSMQDAGGSSSPALAVAGGSSGGAGVLDGVPRLGAELVAGELGGGPAGVGYGVSDLGLAKEKGYWEEVAGGCVVESGELCSGRVWVVDGKTMASRRWVTGGGAGRNLGVMGRVGEAIRGECMVGNEVVAGGGGLAAGEVVAGGEVAVGGDVVAGDMVAVDGGDDVPCVGDSGVVMPKGSWPLSVCDIVSTPLGCDLDPALVQRAEVGDSIGPSAEAGQHSGAASGAAVAAAGMSSDLQDDAQLEIACRLAAPLGEPIATPLPMGPLGAQQGGPAPGGQSRDPSLRAWTVKRCRKISFSDSRSDFLKSDGVTVLADSMDEEACEARLERALVGRVLGRVLPFGILCRELRRMWGKFGELHITSVGSCGFVCFFASMEVRDLVLMGGPWFAEGHLIGVERWSASFDPETVVGLSSPFWVRFPGLPLNLWGDRNLGRIASSLGTPLWVDDVTSEWGRTEFARVCVRICLSERLPTGVWVEASGRRFFQPVFYEGLDFLCFRCGKAGHCRADCRDSAEPARASSGGDCVAQPREADTAVPPSGESLPADSVDAGLAQPVLDQIPSVLPLEAAASTSSGVPAQSGGGSIEVEEAGWQTVVRRRARVFPPRQGGAFVGRGLPGQRRFVRHPVGPGAPRVGAHLGGGLVQRRVASKSPPSSPVASGLGSGSVGFPYIDKGKAVVHDLRRGSPLKSAVATMRISVASPDLVAVRVEGADDSDAVVVSGVSGVLGVSTGGGGAPPSAG